MNELVDLTPQNSAVGILGFVFLGDGLKNWQAEIAKECGGLKGEELRKKTYEVNKRKSMQILADIFFEGDASRPELQEVAIFTGTLSTDPYIRSTYQASTRIETFKKIHALGEDFNEARYRDEKNLVLLGSDFSEEFEGYMEGAIRIANKKVRRLLLPSSSL